MKLQEKMDKFAIGLSAMCAIHCLAVPVLLVLLPSAAALGLGNEQFHFWMLVAVMDMVLKCIFLSIFLKLNILDLIFIVSFQKLTNF